MPKASSSGATKTMNAHEATTAVSMSFHRKMDWAGMGIVLRKRDSSFLNMFV